MVEQPQQAETVVVTGQRARAEGLVPDYQIYARPSNGGEYSDATGKLKERLNSIRLTDNSGMEADQLELVFDDGSDDDLTRGGGIDYPKKGAKLKLWLGYFETGIVLMGEFIVEEVEIGTLPAIINVRAHSAQLSGQSSGSNARSWTSHRRRSFNGKTIGAILGIIASDHNVRHQCDPELSGIVIQHIDQTNEGDSHFLTRLARRNSAHFSIKLGVAIISKAAAARTASGVALPIISYFPSDGDSIRVIDSSRNANGTIRAKWRNRENGKIETETSGSGEPVRTMRHIYANQNDAARAAEAELKRINRAAGGTIEISCTGRPEYLAGGQIKVIDYRSGIDGEWSIKTVEHNMDFEGGGYTCRLNGERT